MTRVTAAVAAFVTAAALTACQTEDPQAVPGDPQAPFQESVMGTNARVGPIKLLSVHVDAPRDERFRPGDNARLWFTVYNEGSSPDVLRSVQSPYARSTQIMWDANCDGEGSVVTTLTFEPAGPEPARSPAGVPPFDAYHAQLIALDREVLAGTTIPVAFTFERAGSVTVDALVQPDDAVRPEPSNRCYGGASVAPSPS